VSDAHGGVGKSLRLLASGGWADHDPDLVADLLRQARQLATLVDADEAASADVRSIAAELIAALDDEGVG